MWLLKILSRIAATLAPLTLAVSGQCEPVTINAVGDIMLSGSSRPILDRSGYMYPFEKTVGILKEKHITVGNLEHPITERGKEYTAKRFRFRAPPEAAKSLKNAGFSLLTLANNHILDYGISGLCDTLTNLDRCGIAHTGAGANLDEARTPVIIEAEGKKFAFLSYSLTLPEEFFAGPTRHGTAPGYTKHVLEDVRLARQKADHLIVSFHWGRELEEKPRSYQVTLARLAIDAGADIVLGHHPHVLQGIERYRRGIIFYSLGNFTFGSSSRHADRSIIARITLDREIRVIEIVPLNVLNREVRYQPAVVTGQTAAALIDRLNRLSAGKGAKIVQYGKKFFLEGFAPAGNVSMK